ncbi:hypothetical protein VZQ01_08315 [Myxococcus faecalis]|uniref:hypothetical protein n=1 Tax=Myxococcus faecalis TaxID=3115646 RepID=UPI003CF727C6
MEKQAMKVNFGTAVKWVLGVAAVAFVGGAYWVGKKPLAWLRAELQRENQQRLQAENQAAIAAREAQQAQRQADAARQQAEAAREREQAQRMRAEQAEAEATKQKKQAEVAAAESAKLKQQLTVVEAAQSDATEDTSKPVASA